jgi:hypothetical protein
MLISNITQSLSDAGKTTSPSTINRRFQLRHILRILFVGFNSVIPLGTNSMNDQPPVHLQGWVNAATISIASLVLAGLALVAALWMYIRGGDSAPLVGAIGLLLGKGSTVVDYWLGSSSGSQRKDSTIALQLPPASPAVLPPVSTTP